MIKILVINTVNFNYRGGMSNLIMNYYHTMDREDVQIDIVASINIDENIKNVFISEGSRVYNLNSRDNKPLQYIRDLTRIIRDGKYDIVHAHGNSCTLAVEMYSARRGGAKVRIAHSHNTTCNHKIIHKLLRHSFDSNYTHAFACSEKAGKWLYHDKPFTVMNNGIDVNKFAFNSATREKLRTKYGFTGKKVVGHIGNFIYQKNHEYLIDIFAELYNTDQDYRLLSLGDGVLKGDIEEKVKSLGLADVVTFTGSTLETAQLLQAMDMIVMPSRFEGLPLTLVEAQTACLPCFVSEEVSKEAVITDLFTFISLEKTPQEWASLIIESNMIIREERKDEIYHEIVRAGFSITDCAIKMKNLYKSFLQDKMT